MAKISEAVAIGVGVQTAEGTPEPNTVAATSLVASSPGANEALGVLPQDDSVSWDSDRVEEERPDFPGTFSASGGTLSRIDVPFGFTTDLKGGGVAGPSVENDWNLTEALEALWLAAGMARGTPEVGTTPYALQSINDLLTFKLWRGGLSYVVYDCKCVPVLNFTPGETANVAWTIEVGSILQGAYGIPEAFPTPIDYGTQLTQASPILKNAGAQIGAVPRGYLDGTITFDNGFEDAPDSNAPSGVVSEQARRRVTWSGGFYVDDADEDQDWANLLNPGPSSDDLTFTLGETGADPAEAIGYTLRNLNYTQVSYRREAGRVIWDITAYGTNDGAGDDEFEFATA